MEVSLQDREPPREAIFISHANPESNAFARWLGAKLAAMGYEVWADVMRLHGGSDWARELEAALRHRAIKMLLACTPTALEKQGVRNEIEIGSQLAAKLNDREFIIPLRLEPFEAPFRIAQTQFIDYSNSWATGFAELVDLLVNIHKVPRQAGRSIENWLAAQTEGSTRLVRRSERLVSNWLKFQSGPAHVRYCEPRSGQSLDRFQDRGLHTWPIVPFGAGVLTFASPDPEGNLGADIRGRVVHSHRVTEFLRAGWEQLGIPPYDARRRFSDLGNQAFESFMRRRGLTGYASSSGRLSWWGNLGTVPPTQVAFDWPTQKGRRQIMGQSGKRNVFWHYAVGGEVRGAPVRHLRLSARLIFSDNGIDAIADVKRMHRLRRSFAKSWRNARWRDMLSAFLWWLADGQQELALPVSHRQNIVLALPTATFPCPVSVRHVGEDPPDEDDPDIELEEWDDWEDDSAEVEDA